MNLVDRLIASLDPVRGLRRHQARRLLAYYEAGRSDAQRKQRRETGSGNEAVLRAGASIRQQARHLEQNYDLALGVLNALVANVVGPQGVGIEPQPRRLDGSIDDDFAAELLELWTDWQCHPEVTRQHDWPGAQRLMARSWFRDGEVFAQLLSGTVRHLDHHTVVPLSLELLEADFVPLDLHLDRPVVRQGIELNAWGAPVGYHVLRAEPDALTTAFLSSSGQTKRIAAASMLHLATRHRIRQLRGVSVFAAVMHRFDDLKDYEESERIAAKVAASMAAFIRKGSPDQYDPDAEATARQLQMRPGMIFDDLRMGEEIGTIDTNRPNPNLEAYRSGQLRAIAAGTGPTYSAVARTYDGTYSAQRQELVEGWNTYGVLSSEFISRVIRPVYETFVRIALASGAVRVPRGMKPETLDDAEYLAPQMPWIDPVKEATAWGLLEDRAYASGPEIVRRRGANPLSVVQQQARWLRAKDAAGIPEPKGTVTPPAPEPDDPDAPEERAAS